MRILCVTNTKHYGLNVIANNEEEAIRIAMIFGHIKKMSDKIRITDVTDECLKLSDSKNLIDKLNDDKHYVIIGRRHYPNETDGGQWLISEIML